MLCVRTEAPLPRLAFLQAGFEHFREAGETEAPVGGNALRGRYLAAQPLDLDLPRQVFDDVNNRVDIGVRAKQRHAGRVGAVLVGQARAADDL